MPNERLHALLDQLLAAVPEKLDDAKLGDVIRAVALLRQYLEAESEQEEVDLDAARQRLTHLIDRVAAARPPPDDSGSA